LVFCGRLEPVKGAEDAIRILSLLPGEYYLDVLGDGVERERLNRLVAELGLKGRVKFWGWVDGATRDKVMGSAGVLVLPSLWDEGFGMAGVEAMGVGTPVVAYEVGGVGEWCRGEAGVLVRCGDVAGAARAVRELTEDQVRWAGASRAARRLAEEEFPAERFGRELGELFEVWS
jgi:glycosyltransferase involved in cell wall biosynthesis